MMTKLLCTGWCRNLADPPSQLPSVAVGHGPTPTPTPSLTPVETGSGPRPQGVVGRWLVDPAGVERELLAGLRTTLANWWVEWRPVVLAVAVVLVVTRVGLAWRRGRAWRRARDGGRWLQVVPPTATSTGQGQTMWRGLAGLLRACRLGRRLRLLAWEVHADDGQVVAGLWVPASIDDGHTARTVTGAHPKARVRTGRVGAGAGPDGLAEPEPASPDVRDRVRALAARVLGAAGQRGRPDMVPGPASAGYLLVPASMWAPLLADTNPGPARSSHTPRVGEADGLRMVFGVLAGTPAGYRAVWQVLARPLPSGTVRAARRVRRAGGGPPGRGLPARAVLCLAGLVEAGVRAVLDIAAPGPTTPASRSGRGRGLGPTVDPVTAQRRRDALTKASGELVEVCVRIVVTGPSRTRCREHAFEAANALRAVTAQPLHAVRLPGRICATIGVRGLGNGLGARFGGGAGHRQGWFVVTDAEVGALARLPHQPAAHRFSTSGAPHLPPPAGIPRLPLAGEPLGPAGDNDEGLDGAGPTLRGAA